MLYRRLSSRKYLLGGRSLGEVATFGGVPSGVPLLAFAGPDFWDPSAVHPDEAETGNAAAALDFWLPQELTVPASLVEPIDFWFPVTVVTTAELTAAATGTPEFPTQGLPWFESDLSTRPPAPATGEPFLDVIARRRARWLVQLLELPSASRRQFFLRYFSDLFLEFDAPQTFKALAALAVDGASADALRSACQCKRALIEHPYLLMRRSPALQLYLPRGKQVQLVSWARAHRLSALVGGDDPLDHVEDAWFDEWTALSPDDGRSWWFLDFVEDRLRAKALGYWSPEEAFLFAHSGGSPVETEPLGLRSVVGQLVYASSERIGVLYPEARSLVSVSFRSNQVGAANSRLLGQRHT